MTGGAATGSRNRLALPALDVARDLLGMHLVSSSPDGDVVLRITEVEAYQGADDPGSHAFRGPSARNRVMFGPAGHLYTYRHLGLHTCANVVCGPDSVAAAVLLRAGELVSGTELARARRTAVGVVANDRDLARGPARLSVALGVTMDLYGIDLLDPHGPLRLEPGAEVPAARVSAGPRVGVSGEGGDGALFPWRLWLTGDPTVSVYRQATPRTRRTRQTRAVETPNEEQQ